MMNRTDLTNHLAEVHGLTKAAARRQVDTLLAAVATRLAAGEDVRLGGFGNFSLRLRPARTGRVAGHDYQRPARFAVRFRAARALAERLPVPGA